MRAVLLRGNGGFEMLDVRDDVPVPLAGTGEVLIRVAAAGVNNTDINTRNAWYAKGVDDTSIGWSGDVSKFPRIQGADACGQVVAIGADVDPRRLGERVLVEPVFRLDGRVVYFGSECDGAFAEFASVPSVHAHRIRCALTDVELASFPCSWSAAENMVERVGVAADDVVLVTGASGGVGSAAVQLARRRGARVIALAAEDKAAQLRALGADEVLSRSDDLAEALGRDAVDRIIDVVGGDRWGSLLDVLRPFGRYAVAGAIAGPVVSLDLRTMYLKDLSLFGCTVLGAQVFHDLVGYIERGEVVPVVARTYPLEEIVAAQQAFLGKGHVGKIVLTIT